MNSKAEDKEIQKDINLLEKVKKKYLVPKMASLTDASAMSNIVYNKSWKDLSDQQKRHILYTMGLDVLLPVRYETLKVHHYTAQGRRMKGVVFIQSERMDDEWLSSGAATRQAHEHMTQLARLHYEQVMVPLMIKQEDGELECS